MLYKPQPTRKKLAELVRYLLSWRPAPRRIDIRDLSGHLRADIGAPRCPAAAPRPDDF